MSAAWLKDVPLPLLYGGFTAAALGVVGGVVGLFLGLRANPSTAWAAVFEVGLPAGFLGALIGLLVGWVVWLFRPDRR